MDHDADISILQDNVEPRGPAGGTGAPHGAAAAADEGGSQMRQKNLNVVAGEVADYLARQVAAGRSGVLALQSIGHLLAFDRAAADRADRLQYSLELMHGALAYLGLPVLGYGYAFGRGHAWAMIIGADPREREAAGRAREALRACRAAAAEDEARERVDRLVQKEMAADAIDEIESFRHAFA